MSSVSSQAAGTLPTAGRVTRVGAARASEPSHARRTFPPQAKRRVGGGKAGTFHRAPIAPAIAPAIAAAVLILVLALSSSALAGTLHPFVSSFEAGSNPQALTVDQATGDVLVVDVGAGAVLKFDAAGNPVSFSALGSNVLDGASGADLTPHGQFAFDSPSAAQVAVDNSGGPAAGYIYVVNLSNTIDVFDSTGTYVGEIDGSAASPQSGGELCGVAVDPSGNVYAGYHRGHIDKYVPTDANPVDDTFAGQFESVGGVCNVAADGLGNVYASGWPSGPLTRYDSSQLNQASASGTVVDRTSTAVAVDPATNDVYVDEGGVVAQFDSSGAQVGRSSSGNLSGNSQGVGFDAGSGNLYASDSSAAQVLQFAAGIFVAAPIVTIDPPSSITSTSATFSGTVNPNGTDPLEDASWHFEYSLDGGATWTSTTGGDAGTGTSPVQVSDTVGTFLPDQAVQVRLVASNAANDVTSSVESFTTVALAPDVATGQPQDITPDHATLTATLNAHNTPTTYFFEIGPTTSYGTSLPASQDADGGSGASTVGLAQPLYHLTAGTTYHYRVVAHNLVGTTTGQDQTFTTTRPLPASAPRQGIPGTGALPDERGWEQASPPDKHGSDVLIDAGRTRASATETPGDPMAVTFGSLGAFADVHGTGVGSDYMAIRTGQPATNGWTTHAITPPQRLSTFLGTVQGFEPAWAGEFSPDLSRGIVRSWTPLTSDPSVSEVANLYRRDDLRTPGQGAYQLLSACTLCSTPLPPISQTAQLPWFAGASSDFAHVLFESTFPLVAGSTASDGNPNLYEFDRGTLRLAGILPDSACATSPCVAPASFAGTGSELRLSPRAISSDGSRIIFTDPSTGFDGLSGKLYMRINAASTVQLNASEKASPDPAQQAKFQTASSDGTRVFFTTAEQLTDTLTRGVGDLYMYDSSAPVGHHLTLISVGHSTEDTPNGVQGVIGASADGHYVYFIASGQFVAGQPVLGADIGVYEWHDGVTSFIGSIPPGLDVKFDVQPNFWVGGPIASRVTPDGKHMLFQSSGGLAGYQSNGHVELYLYNGDTHELQCVSCRPDGTPATSDAGDMSRTFTGATGTASHISHALTDDGGRVFFTTTDALVPQDVNGKRDAYEFDSATGTVHLLSSGSDNSDSYFMDASANGNDVFFLTRQQLVGWDNDQNYDLYDARVSGGLPNPPTPPIPCSGEECLGMQAAETTPPALTSNSLKGAGNFAASPSPSTRPAILTRAQKLAKALRVCHQKRNRHKRAVCERTARRRFGAHRASKRHGRSR